MRDRVIKKLKILSCLIAIAFVIIFAAFQWWKPIFAHTISHDIYLRFWDYTDRRCRVTYHRGIAIGLHSVDYFESPISLGTARFVWVEDNKSHVQCVYDDVIGVVFLFRSEKGEYWTAGRTSGCYGTPLAVWQETLESLQAAGLVPRNLSLNTKDVQQ